MPFKSPRQEAYLFMHEPETAKKWYNEHGHAKGYREYLRRRKKKKKAEIETNWYKLAQENNDDYLIPEYDRFHQGYLYWFINGKLYNTNGDTHAGFILSNFKLFGFYKGYRTDRDWDVSITSDLDGITFGKDVIRVAYLDGILYMNILQNFNKIALLKDCYFAVKNTGKQIKNIELDIQWDNFLTNNCVTYNFTPAILLRAGALQQLYRLAESGQTDFDFRPA